MRLIVIPPHWGLVFLILEGANANFQRMKKKTKRIHKTNKQKANNPYLRQREPCGKGRNFLSIVSLIVRSHTHKDSPIWLIEWDEHHNKKHA